MLALKGLVGLYRTVQLPLLQRYWLGHRLGLLWYWMVCLGNEQRSFCRLWDCIQYYISDSFIDHDGNSISSKGADCGSDHELLIAKLRLKLKKVGKTTRTFRYDLNQIAYNYTVEVRNRFKGLDLINRVPDELWMEVHNILQETGIKTNPKEKKVDYYFQREKKKFQKSIFLTYNM